ncbi:MAG: DUF1194 domain-containing protein [Inquilinus sp.]|nr:DUF1194 domain-containing protein [Inquilinus sp.]
MLSPVPARSLERADICMAIGLDVSGSIGADEMQLQFHGLARALNHPRLVRAIESGRHGLTAITVFTWSARRDVRVVVPWSGIRSAKDTEHVSAMLFQLPVGEGEGNTSLDAAIRTGTRLLTACPWYADRQLLNIAGDVVSNIYPGPEEARDVANAMGIVINGLVIDSEEFAALAHYEGAVVGPPGMGFVVTVRDYRSFQRGMLRKLLLEIAMAVE